jgi:hypothetical protein
MAVADPVVMPLARQLLACLDVEIQKVLNPPAHVQLRIGTVVDHLISLAGDECCEGLAWVRPAGFYPMGAVFPDQLPSPLKGNTTGANAWVVQLEMGAIRCFPTPEPDDLITGAQWDAVTQAVMDDAAAMRRALCCIIAELNEARPGLGSLRVLAGIWQPISNEGGCTGGILPITIQGPACDCQDAGPVS